MKDSIPVQKSKWFDIQHYIPQTILCLRQGYSLKLLSQDLFAGMTVGVIALPLAMAFAIASGLPPALGLYTAIVAGFLNALFSGSPVQIGGPTGAFVVIVFNVAAKHGYDGLALATFMAGGILILMGLARFGVLLRFISYPVLTGFTLGISILIACSQVKDFMGLHIDKVPADFIHKWESYVEHFSSWNPFAIVIAVCSLLLIIGVRRWLPKAPSYLFAVIASSAAVWFFQMPIDTIGSAFGSVPNTLPAPHLPVFTLQKVLEVLPDSFVIALLAAIESLLCAMVADGMLGTVHKADCELVAQGIANVGSVIFGGIPATGAIARTAANIRMGAKTPIAGMVHALVLLLLMWTLAPLAEMIPLAALSAILMMVAWQMSDVKHIREFLKAPKSELVVMVITFLVTVLIDLTEAVKIGVILSSFVFLKHMSEKTTLSSARFLVDQKDNNTSIVQDPEALYKKDVPDEIAIFEFNGPLFFASTELFRTGINHLNDVKHKVYILRMRHVPIIDTSGVKALRDFTQKCNSRGVKVLISGASDEFLKIHKNAQLPVIVGKEHLFSTTDEALKYAKKLIATIE